MENTQNLSPWTLPKLRAPSEPPKPSKRGRYSNHNGLHPIAKGRKTIYGLSKAADARMMDVPSRDSINTETVASSSKTAKILRGAL